MKQNTRCRDKDGIRHPSGWLLLMKLQRCIHSLKWMMFWVAYLILVSFTVVTTVYLKIICCGTLYLTALFKVQIYLPINYCNFHFNKAVMVTICGVPTGFLYCPPHVLKSQSKGTTKKELRLIFQAKFNPSFLSPKINICSGKLWHKMMFLIMVFYITPILWNLY